MSRVDKTNIKAKVGLDEGNKNRINRANMSKIDEANIEANNKAFKRAMLSIDNSANNSGKIID